MVVHCSLRCLPVVRSPLIRTSLPSHRTLSANTLSTRPFLVDGRPLLPSLPSRRTLSADTLFAAFPSYALSADTLRESKLLPPFTRVQPSAGGRPRYRRRAIGDTYSVPSRLGPSVDGRRRMSGSPVKKETLFADQKNKFLGLTVDGRARMLRSFARRRQKCMGCGNLTI